METVKLFGNELNSIQECRPPVSRAKMGSITKLAMKCHKYYKHVVMLVEKFISKSSVEYKVPGLYVIDSIVRQSRHQFSDKDSFGPRFTKNFEKTFLHLFQCPEEDKPKIVRVLNLWQKNEVFPSSVIQPLLALASTDVIHGKVREQQQRHHRDRPGQDRAAGKTGEEEPVNQANLDLSTATTIIQQQQEQISALLQQQQQLQTQATSLLAPALSNVLVGQQQQPQGQLEALSSLLQQTQQLQQLQAIQQRLANGDEGGGAVGGVPAQISNVESVGHSTQQPLFNEAVLDDFDYSDEEDTLDRVTGVARQKEMNKPPPVPLMPDNDSVKLSRSSPLGTEPPEPLFPKQELPPFSRESLPPLNPPPLAGEGHPYPSEMGGGGNPPMPPSSEHFSPGPPPNHPPYPHPPHPLGGPPPPPQIHPGPLGPPGPPGHPGRREWSRQHPPPLPPHYPPPPRSPSPRMRRESRFSSPPPLLGRRSPSPPPPHRPWRDRERSRWSPPPLRRRSRSPPPPHLRRMSRERSRSPPHTRWHRAATPPEKQERRRKGIPFPRDDHMTVCSTTLWVGHLSKLATKDTVKEAFEDFGQIKSVELVQARGCAYLVMMHRNDAIRALNSLRDLKLGGSICKLAWAPGRGVKGAGLKAFWNQDVGSSYIPWSFMKAQSDVDTMGDGGWIDTATIPPGMKAPVVESVEEDLEAAAVPPAPVQPPVNVPPGQNIPQPPVPSFPQLMNPTAAFQAPGEMMSPFAPRGVPNSQGMPQPPPFSQPNGGGPFGSLRPPMGGEPQPGMPQQPMHRLPPPPMGGVPQSMAPPYGGQHNMPPRMAGGPQMSMHQPQMMPQPPPQPMMPPPTRNMRPFLPHMGGPQPPVVVSAHPMGGEHSGRPIRPLMPPYMGDVPRSGHPMAPHMGEGPRPSFGPQMVSEAQRGHLAPHGGEGPRPPFAPLMGNMPGPSMFFGQRVPMMQPNLPPMPAMTTTQAEVFQTTSSKMELATRVIETETETVKLLDSGVQGSFNVVPIPMDEESTEPVPMEEDGKETESTEEPQVPPATKEPDKPVPKEPLTAEPPVGEEPMVLKGTPPLPPEEQPPVGGEPSEPLSQTNEEPREPTEVPTEANEAKEEPPTVEEPSQEDTNEPHQMAPPTGEVPNQTVPIKPLATSDKGDKSVTTSEPIADTPPTERPLETDSGGDGSQEEKEDEALSDDDNMQISTTDEEDLG